MIRFAAQTRSASKAIFAFSAALIFRLVFVVIIRSVYHDRTALFQLLPWSHFQGPARSANRPDGSVDRVIDMPVKKVTSVMFGRPDLDVLYVTSMTKPPLPRFPGDGVLRGALFTIYGLGVRSVPEARFAG